MMEKKRSKGITICALAYIIVGLFVFICKPFFIPLAIFGLLMIISGIGILLHKKWGALIAIALLAMPSLFGLVTLVNVLLKPSIFEKSEGFIILPIVWGIIFTVPFLISVYFFT